VVALIINTVVRVADVSAQNEFYKELFKLFVSCEPSKLVSSNQELLVANFRPLSPDANEAQAETVQIFVSAIAAARKEVIPPKIPLTLDYASCCGYKSSFITSCRYCDEFS
jgi:hypothetical protein